MDVSRRYYHVAISVLTFTLMLNYSVFGYVCDCPEKNEKTFHVFHSELSWHEALLNCSSQGMKLATILSQEEQNKFDAAIAKAGPYHSHLWIGGADLLKQGDYIWFSTGEPMTFQYFDEKQPDNSQKNGEGDTEHCVEAVNYRNSTYQWNDMFCEKKRPFVCHNYTVELH